MSARLRPKRIAVRGARAHVANAAAEVVNVSRTGVLIRAPYPLRTGTEWPLTLELSQTPLLLTGQVVRCEPLADPQVLPGHHQLALRFLAASVEARAALSEACGRSLERPARPALSLRPLSMVRRCPRCLGVRVVKEGRRRYFCESCNSRFTGLRLGPIRLAF
jgi:hypothetical protein